MGCVPSSLPLSLSLSAQPPLAVGRPSADLAEKRRGGGRELSTIDAARPATSRSQKCTEASAACVRRHELSKARIRPRSWTRCQLVVSVALVNLACEPSAPSLPSAAKVAAASCANNVNYSLLFSFITIAIVATISLPPLCHWALHTLPLFQLSSPRRPFPSSGSR